MEQVVLGETRTDGCLRSTGVDMGISLSMDSLERILRVNFANYCGELQAVKAELQKEVDVIHMEVRRELAAQKWWIIGLFTVFSTSLVGATYFIAKYQIF